MKPGTVAVSFLYIDRLCHGSTKFGIENFRHIEGSNFLEDVLHLL